MTVINHLKKGKYSDRGNVLYLRKVDDKISCDENPSLPEIENHLNVIKGKKASSPKIKVYCEDAVAVSFANKLLPKSINDHVEFVNNIHLSWTVYRDLYKGKVPEFLNNIILLDGDAKKPLNGWKNYPKTKNVVFLPGELFPEKLVYELLFETMEADPFWDKGFSGYTKQICFRDFPNKLTENDHIKQWFRSQKEHAGRGYTKYWNVWITRNNKSVSEFLDEFVNAYNYSAGITGRNKL